MLGKNSSQKLRKNVFLYSHEYGDQKMKGKNARNHFSRNSPIERAKNVRKKMVAKKLFLYSHVYRDQKMGGKNARNNFSRNTPIGRAKNVGKKSSQKVRKGVFYIHTNIVTKKWRGNAQNNFSRIIPIVRAKNFGKKIVAKKCEKSFLYSHEYRDEKMGEKRAKQFFQKHTNSASKKCWEKNRRTNVRKKFFIFTRIS